MIRVCAVAVIAGLFPLLVAGCGGGGLDDDPETANVSGTATVNGTPLKGAGIYFQPTDGRAGREATTNDNGEFTGEAIVGDNIIVITAPGGAGHGGGKAAGDSSGINKSVLTGAETNPLKLNIPADGKSGIKIEAGTSPSAS